MTSTDWPSSHPYPRPDSPPLLSPAQAEHTLDVWLVPKFSMLTLVCLLEPLRVANRFGRDLFAWRLLSSNGEPVMASNGVRIDVDGRLAEVTEADWYQGIASSGRLMVVSSYEPEAMVTVDDLLLLKRLSAYGVWLGGLDTAPFILARAGVMEGYPVALHWESVPAFREEFPGLEVRPDSYVWEGARLTGSGGSASIDMMLEWVTTLYGPALAEAVGRQIMHSRPQGDGHAAGHIDPVDNPAAGGGLPRPVLKALAVMEANLTQALSIPDVCRLAGLSQRQLTRRFMAEFGETPKQCYLNMRLDQAQRMLADSRMTVTAAAVAVGFTHLAHFSRAYRRRFGEAPSVTARRGLGPGGRQDS
ncbi:GlxA family transcriptional regulator [Halomonas denitrificans]|uniref:GlxA family transcriptional regulator n=1 Tax=Halomonas TaxID=2745 RepID=UPI001C977BF3|nr:MULTISPECIES: GlxA family transcriptional regulator [Halomonas]MBY5927750.1 GlxA family transcriptional regulator [Halomonas sp. DP8Y7-3]MCA0973505.1 GlxA family transcriptional regulator [Halomonas denitrificans]